jgi:Mg-chelatase subunit ChlI
MGPVLCPVVVGRDDDELRLLAASIDAALEARGGAIVISGEAGIGKTRLARSAEELAGERGMVVLGGRASAVRRRPGRARGSSSRTRPWASHGRSSLAA